MKRARRLQGNRRSRATFHKITGSGQIGHSPWLPGDLSAAEPCPRAAGWVLRAALFKLDCTEVDSCVTIDRAAGRDILCTNLPVPVQGLMAASASRVM